MYINLPPEAACPTCSGGAIDEGLTPARVEATGIAGGQILNPHVVKEWFTRPTLAAAFIPEINVRPTLNLEDFHSIGSYEPTESIRDRVRLTHDSCVFPFCSVRAWKCDLDHTQPWQTNGGGGATCTCNLAPLCRRHHRLKTHCDNESDDSKHGTWHYTHLEGSQYYWRGPRGIAFVRSLRGTFEAAGDGGTGAPIHAHAPITSAERFRYFTAAVKIAFATATKPQLTHVLPVEPTTGLNGEMTDYAIAHGRST